MKRLIALLGSLALTASASSAAVGTTSINSIVNDKSLDLSSKTKQYDETYSVLSNWSNSLTENEKNKVIENLLNNLVEVNGILRYNISKLDSNLFNTSVLKIMSKVKFENLSIEKFKTSVFENNFLLKDKTISVSNFFFGWEMALDMPWWVNVTGFFYINFNNKLSSDIAFGFATSADIAGIIAEACGLTPTPLAALLAAAAAGVAIACLGISFVFKDNNYGNGIWIGINLLPLFFPSGWGSSGHNW